jgi:hypothetical protein
MESSNPAQKKVKLTELGQPADELGRPTTSEKDACDLVDLCIKRYSANHSADALDTMIRRVLFRTDVYQALVIHQNPPILDATVTFAGKHLIQGVRDLLEEYERVAVFRKLSYDDSMKFIREAIVSGLGIKADVSSIILEHYHTGYALAIYADTNLYRCAMSCREFVPGPSGEGGFAPTGAEIEEAARGVMEKMGRDPMSYHVRVVRGLVDRRNDVRTFRTMDEVREAVCAQVKSGKQ